MNPRSDTPSAGGLAPSPAHSHELTQAEVLELGVLAVEEPHEDATTVAPMGIPASSPLPPTTVVAPQAAPTTSQEAAAVDPSPKPVIKRGVVQPLTAISPAPVADSAVPTPVPPQPTATTTGVVTPSVSQEAAASKPAPEAAPSLPTEQPATIAPKATPSKAPDIAAPVHAAPPLAPMDAEATASQSVASPSVVSTDRMELSANSMNLKSISRLRTVGVAMNVLVIVLIIGIITGGWYVYTHVLQAGGTSLF